MVHAMDFGRTLYMWYMDFVYGFCIYFGLCRIYDFRLGLFSELRVALKQHYRQ